jgi:hypothetical protein
MILAETDRKGKRFAYRRTSDCVYCASVHGRLFAQLTYTFVDANCLLGFERAEAVGGSKATPALGS